MIKLTGRNLALLGVIIYFTFIGGTFYSQINLFLRVINQLFVSSILGVWLFIKIRNREGLPATPLDLAVFLYLLVNFVSALAGQSARYSLEVLWFSIVHVLAFYLLLDLIRRGWLVRLTWAFYMTSAVVCIVGLTEFLAWYFGVAAFGGSSQSWPDIGGWQNPIPPTIYRLAITLNGATPLSAYLALLIPPAIALIFTLPAPNENRLALMLWLLLAFIVQVLTFSRAGILALVISLSLTAFRGYKIYPQKVSVLGRLWQKLKLWPKILLLLSGIILLVTFIFWLQYSFTNRSYSIRFNLWQIGFDIFRDNIILGVGPANYGRALLRLNQSTLFRVQIASAHNIYLNTLAETGLMGFLVGGYLYISLALACLYRWRQEVSGPYKFVLLACGAALVGFAAQTLVDTYSATPNILLLVALVAYISAGDLVKNESKPSKIFNLIPEKSPALKHGDLVKNEYRPSKINNLVPEKSPALKYPLSAYRRYVPHIALSILLLYGLGFVRIAQADFATLRSVQAEGRGDLGRAVTQAALAYDRDPWLTGRIFKLALLEAKLAHKIDPKQGLEAAISHYQTGLAQEPIRGLNSANLAGLLWQQEQYPAAIETLEQTILAESAPLYLVNLGYFYEQQGDWSAAIAAYGRAIFISPGLAASGFWQATPSRQERWPDIVESSMGYLGSNDDLSQKSLRLKLALAGQDFELLEKLLQGRDLKEQAQFQLPVAELYLSQGQPEQVLLLLGPKLKSGPDYFLHGRAKLQLAEAKLQLAEAKLHLADQAAAEKSLKTAAFLGHKEAYYYLGQLFEQQGDLQAAITAYQQGFVSHATSENAEMIIYGRFAGNDLAPQLLRIGVGPKQAQAWLRLAQLYEEQHHFAAARQIYGILLAEDPFLTLAQKRLTALNQSESLDAGQ